MNMKINSTKKLKKKRENIMINTDLDVVDQAS